MTDETQDAQTGHCRDGMERDEEPARVWEVSCACGFSAKFRHKEDAHEVFEAHSTNWDDGRCGSGSMEAMHAYPKGEIDAKQTLPEERLADLRNLTEPEGPK